MPSLDFTLSPHSVLTFATQSSAAVRRVALQPSRLVPGIVVCVLCAALVSVTWTLARRTDAAAPGSEVIAVNLLAAQIALEEGRYVDPAGHNATHYYSVVLALDPDNAAAERGIDGISELFVKRAKQAILDGRFADAVTAIDQVRRIRPTDRRIGYMETQLSKALDRYVMARSPATIDQKRSDPNTTLKRPSEKRETRLALAQGASADTAPEVSPPPSFAPHSRIEPQHSEADQLRVPAPEVLPIPPQLSASLASEGNAAPLAVMSTTEEAPPPAAPESQPSTSLPARDTAVATPDLASVPKLLHMVQPSYPRAAQVRGIEGWVDLSVDVGADGSVADVRVVDRRGSREFEQSALTAVRGWQYSPDTLGAKPVRTVAVRVQFRLEPAAVDPRGDTLARLATRARFRAN